MCSLVVVAGPAVQVKVRGVLEPSSRVNPRGVTVTESYSTEYWLESVRQDVAPCSPVDGLVAVVESTGVRARECE